VGFPGGILHHDQSNHLVLQVFLKVIALGTPKKSQTKLLTRGVSLGNLVAGIDWEDSRESFSQSGSVDF
jgi:hypothetical protein